MKQLDICNLGCVILEIFYVLTIAALAFCIPGYFGVYEGSIAGGISDDLKFWLIISAILFLILFVIWAAGIVMVYLTSKQLGIRWRVIGVICGWIPVLNVIMLTKIIMVCSAEVKFERAKMKLNKMRKNEQVCKTKYPILMVHGVFFRDFEHLNYWGRIPEELINNGATIYYGNHNSASAVDNSAKELEVRIKEIVQQTGCEKVNIIAHSKGGLDSRTAIAKTSIAPMVASLTTINTPHRGCEFADYLLEKIPFNQQQTIAYTYNTAAAALGDINPDFLAAVHDLTFKNCAERNKEVHDDPNVFYQSYGSKINKPGAGRFPLNFTSAFVKSFDGPNDGLVGENSFKWGSVYGFIETKSRRGISHGDVIDLNRENVKGYDVREFYVSLVADLKRRGF